MRPSKMQFIAIILLNIMNFGHDSTAQAANQSLFAYSLYASTTSNNSNIQTNVWVANSRTATFTVSGLPVVAKNIPLTFTFKGASSVQSSTLFGNWSSSSEGQAGYWFKLANKSNAGNVTVYSQAGRNAVYQYASNASYSMTVLVQNGTTITLDSTVNAEINYSYFASVNPSVSLILESITSPYFSTYPTFRVIQDRVSLAQQVLHGNATLATMHVSGVVDYATAYQNIVDTADGSAARRSYYENAPGGTSTIDPRLLDGIATIATAYNIKVSEIVGGSHSVGSAHYSGLAFDINNVNGVAVSKNNHYVLAIRTFALSLGAAKVLDPLNEPVNHYNHIHVEWSKPQLP